MTNISKAYHVSGVLPVKWCIRGNGFPKKEWTIATRSPEKPVTDGLLSLKGVDVLLHEVDGGATDV